MPQSPFGGERKACVRLSFPLLVDQVDAPPNHNSEWRVHAIKLQMSFRRSFDQQRLYLFRGGVLHMRQNMRIDIECERHAGMSQLFTDDLWGDPRRSVKWLQPYDVGRTAEWPAIPPT